MKRKHVYYRVFEYIPEDVMLGTGEQKRFIYAFDNESDANDLMFFLQQRDNMPVDLRVEEFVQEVGS